MARNLNRVLAIVTATTMVLGSSVTAFATSGTAVELTGTGTELSVMTDVYTVTVPTGDALQKLLKFNVDPQGLVAASGNAFGAAVTVNDNDGVLFKNTNNDKVSVSGTSDAIEVINKSYKPVALKLEPKITAAASGYDKGFSTTSDFSTETDAATGLYFGFISTGEVEKALSTTALDVPARIQSDAAEYELKATNADGTTNYAYAAKADAKGVTYSMKVVAALNKALPLATWQDTAENGTVTAKGMPTINIKFTPTQIKSTIGQAKWNSSWAIQFALPGGTAADGGITEAPTAVKWNGKDIAGDITLKDGWAVVSWGQLITAYNTSEGTEFTNSKYEDVIWNETNVIEWTFNGANYIADVK